ncbi:MAG: roadblock/LC7 domain-containing protein [Candidatus Thorarchaeota archaeon]
MSLSGQQIEDILHEFEANTEGILGCSIIYAKDALLLAESSQKFERLVIQWLSEKMLSLAKESLQQLMNEYTLQSVTIEEKDHFVYLRPIGEEYYAVIITTKEENRGLLEHNIRRLLEQLAPMMLK